MTMITPSYLGETIEYSSLHACRSTLEDPTCSLFRFLKILYRHPNYPYWLNLLSLIHIGQLPCSRTPRIISRVNGFLREVSPHFRSQDMQRLVVILRSPTSPQHCMLPEMIYLAQTMAPTEIGRNRSLEPF